MLILFGCTDTVNVEFEKPIVAKTKPVEDVYFGKSVVDLYRYMENLEDSSVIEWIKSQADYSRKVLNSIPNRQSLIDKMLEFDKRRSSKISQLSITDDDRYFYLKQTPEDETGKLFYRDGYEGDEVILFDPLIYGEDSTKRYVISGFSPSFDGRKIILGISEGGSENALTMIMKVDNKTLYSERIPNCVDFYQWLPDNESFTYLPYNSGDVSDMNRKINREAKIHFLGTDPGNDRIIFSRSKYPNLGIEPSDAPLVIYSKVSGYLFGFAATVDRNLKVFYAPASTLKDEQIPWNPLIMPEDEIYNFSVTKEEIFLYTPKNAPNFEILKTSLKNPDVNNAEVVIPEDDKRTIKSFQTTKDGLYFTMSKNGVEENLFFLANGMDKPVELKLPFKAGVVNIRTKSAEHSDVWVTIAGWISDPQRYRYIPETDEFKLENLSEKAEFPEYKDLVVEELMVESYDGVMVPLSLIYKEGTERDASTPVMIRGYGAYGASMNPSFNAGRLLWVAEGGIVATAHVRGGGELGNEWYKGGFKTTKQNTWKDLIACAEYLIRESYTSPEHIAIISGSAGGILVGRAMTERPDLFAAVIPAVGAMNTLRLEFMPNGPANIPEFGTVNDSIECMALLEMDSYHHLKEGVSYPATLVTAGINDPRVIAWQPAKFAARLQSVNTSDKPILFWADFESGHGVGNTKSKRFENVADIMSFALWNTGHPDYQLELK